MLNPLEYVRALREAPFFDFARNVAIPEVLHRGAGPLSESLKAMPDPRDYARALRGLVFFHPRSNETISYVLQKAAAEHPERPYLCYEDLRFTYAEANAIINRYVHAYKRVGIRKGGVVALMLENRPEFLWHYLALNKLGAVAALINNNLAGDTLLHALSVSGAEALVVGAECWSKYAEVQAQVDIPAERRFAESDGDLAAPGELPTFAEIAANASTQNPPEAANNTLQDVALYIFTSGTTGMPKAAVVRNLKSFRYAHMLGGIGFDLEPGDVLYNCLPLYHSNGLVVATPSVVYRRATMALARKFSARHFMDDCRKYGATTFVYIGELCRYLMNTPERPNDADNALRTIVGNGLRPDIWEAFKTRFGIARVAEFYGSTEGNAGTVNLLNVTGSCGTMLPGMVLARWDENAQDFARGSDGFLQKVGPDEPGVLLMRIHALSRFDGYRDKKATENKVLRDVFKRGDAYFNTGDLLKRDRMRNLFFVDRLGDTFRWKGENVSTFEVQENLSKWEPVHEANVYGVKVGELDGRAGMASLVLSNGREFDPKAFGVHVSEVLPAYARPLFVRIQPAQETTSTLKLKKVDLVKDGFDPSRVDDPLYFLDPKQGTYVPLDGELHAAIVRGEVRV